MARSEPITTRNCSSSKTLNSHATPTPPGSLIGLKTSPPTHAARLSLHPLPPSIHRCLHFLLSSTETTGSFLSILCTPVLLVLLLCSPTKPPSWSTPPGCLLHSHTLGCQALNLVLHDPASFLLNLSLQPRFQWLGEGMKGV